MRGPVKSLQGMFEWDSARHKRISFALSDREFSLRTVTVLEMNVQHDIDTDLRNTVLGSPK